MREANTDLGKSLVMTSHQTVTSQTPHSQTVPKQVSPTQHTLDPKAPPWGNDMVTHTTPHFTTSQTPHFTTSQPPQLETSQTTHFTTSQPPQFETSQAPHVTTSQPPQFETSQTQKTSRPTQGNIVSTPSRLQPHGLDPMLQLMFTRQKQQQQMLDAIQLPKTEIVKFDGDPLMHWLFIRSFESNVDRVLFDNTTKLTRLIYYCTGKALKAIQCCAAINPDEGFYRAKSIIKEMIS